MLVEDVMADDAQATNGRDYAAELDMGDQERHRLAKIEELRRLGIDPYPPRSERTHAAAGAIAEFEQWESLNPPAPADGTGGGATPPAEEPPSVVLVGRMRLRRTGGKVTFAHIEDESGRVQLY